MSNRLIDLQHITKIFDGEKILDDLNLYIRENEFLTLLGPSGCGKTTTLKMINRLIPATGGRILIDGEDIESIDKVKLRLKANVNFDLVIELLIMAIKEAM